MKQKKNSILKNYGISEKIVYHKKQDNLYKFIKDKLKYNNLLFKIKIIL